MPTLFLTFLLFYFFYDVHLPNDYYNTDSRTKITANPPPIYDVLGKHNIIIMLNNILRLCSVRICSLHKNKLTCNYKIFLTHDYLS